MRQSQKTGQKTSAEIGQDLGQRQELRARQLIELTTAQPQELEEQIREELATHPGLDIDDGPDVLDPMPREEGGDWNPDFAKPQDEWEDGLGPDYGEFGEHSAPSAIAILERIAEERCADDGDLDRAVAAIREWQTDDQLPGDAESWLVEAVAALPRESIDHKGEEATPTFEVARVGDRVIATVVASVVERLRLGIGPVRLLAAAAEVIERGRTRLVTLNGIARHVLAGLQRDFFLANDLKGAFLQLLPVSVSDLQALGIRSGVQFKGPYVSRLGDLLVASPHAVLLPLSVFLPGTATVRQIWVRAAIGDGHSSYQAIQGAIQQGVRDRLRAWPESDPRRPLLARLLEVAETDIQNDFKKLRGIKASSKKPVSPKGKRR